MTIGRLAKVLFVALGAAGGALASGGCSTTPSRVSDLESKMKVNPEKIQPVEVEDAKEEAQELWDDIVAWYESDIKSDSAINIDGDVASYDAEDTQNIADFLHRAEALKKNSKVQGNAEAKALVEKSAGYLAKLKEFYESNVWKSGVARIFVDALEKETGRHMNYGGTSEKGGYVFPATLGQIEDALTYSMVEAKADEEKARAEAKKLVTELKKEALYETELAGTDVEKRNEISTQISYRQMRTIVTLLSQNDMMRQSVAALEDNAGGIFQGCHEGLNLQYVVDSVRMTPEEVKDYHPNNYQVPKPEDKVKPANPNPAENPEQAPNKKKGNAPQTEGL